MVMQIKHKSSVSERLYIALKLNVECMRYVDRMRKVQGDSLSKTSGTVLSEMKLNLMASERQTVESFSIMSELIREYMEEVLKDEKAETK